MLYILLWFFFFEEYILLWWHSLTERRKWVQQYILFWFWRSEVMWALGRKWEYIPFGDVKSCEQCGASDRREDKTCHAKWGPHVERKVYLFSIQDENSPIILFSSRTFETHELYALKLIMIGAYFVRKLKKEFIGVDSSWVWQFYHDKYGAHTGSLNGYIPCHVFVYHVMYNNWRLQFAETHQIKINEI